MKLSEHIKNVDRKILKNFGCQWFFGFMPIFLGVVLALAGLDVSAFKSGTTSKIMSLAIGNPPGDMSKATPEERAVTAESKVEAWTTFCLAMSLGVALVVAFTIYEFKNNHQENTYRLSKTKVRLANLRDNASKSKDDDAITAEIIAIRDCYEMLD